MHIVYSNEKPGKNSPLLAGPNVVFRNAVHYTGPDAAAKKVTVIGGYQRIAKDYQGAGVEVTVMTDVNDPKPRKLAKVGAEEPTKTK